MPALSVERSSRAPNHSLSPYRTSLSLSPSLSLLPLCLSISFSRSLDLSRPVLTVQRRPDTVVVWVDAHADLNTDKVSPSGNIHGMPVAMLMGLIDV